MNMALQMVVLMLDDTRTNALEDLLVFLEVLVKIAETNFVFTDHFLIDIGQAEAALLKCDIIAEGLEEFGVDEHLFEALRVRIVGIEGVAVGDEETDTLVDLWCSQADALGMDQCLPHVSQQLLKLGIVGRDGLGYGL